MEPKLVTAPDFDLSAQTKIMMVDFPLEHVQFVCDLLARCPVPMTLYTYNSYHKDIRWCLQAAAQSRSILINLGLSNHIELLKGYLLSLPQAYAYGGDCEFARARMHDMSIWITKIAGEPGDRINYIQEVINE